jgi:ABC-type uncharacterized transport system involved in gliding motility auxiliary subunit
MPDNSKKKRVDASNALLFAAFVAGAVVVVNLLGTRAFGRLDLTENKTYTLSPSSKALVKNLPDYMTVKAFISQGLPPELKTAEQYVRDLVDEYRTSSNGKFRWEAVDLGDANKPNDEAKKKLEEEASRCKVEKLQIQVLRGEKFEVGAYYLGLCLQYGSEVESIPQIVNPEGLEYRISSIIKKLTTKKKKIAFTTGHGESDTNQGFQALKGALDQEYDITSVNPSSAEIGKDVEALIVGGPKQAIDEKGQREIDKFLVEGKGVIFLIDGMTLGAPSGMQGQMAQMKLKMVQSNETGLGKLLDAYGFKIGQNFVFDERNAPGPIDLDGRTMLAQLPSYVVGELEQSKDLTLVAGLRAAVFPYPSSVELTGPLASGKPASGQLWRIAATSAKSWKRSDMFIIAGAESYKGLAEPKGERGTSALGYAYSGVVKSAFAPATAAPVSDPTAPPTESKKPVRLVVIGDSDFANDEYVQLSRYPMLNMYGTGAELLYKAIAWTVEDEALAPLRLKTMTARTFTMPASAGVTEAVRYGNWLGLPLAFCAFGVLRWRVRRASRANQKL